MEDMIIIHYLGAHMSISLRLSSHFSLNFSAQLSCIFIMRHLTRSGSRTLSTSITVSS